MGYKYKTKLENKIGILGENVLINNKTITAFYIIESVNYKTLSFPGVRRHIDRMESMLTTLSTQRPGVKFSIFNIEKVMTSETVRENLIDTVRMWDDSYEDIPEIFKKYIEDDYQKFSILSVQIEITDESEIEDMNIKGLFKGYINMATQALFSYSNINIDSKRVLAVESSIFNTVRNYGVRASRELTFYIFASSVFPSYSISYDKNSYVEKNFTPILGAIRQEIKNCFGGYFEMSNSGVELFGLEARTTYGSIIDVLELPEKINSDNFNISFPTMKIHVKTIPRDRAKIAMKRNRADLEFEEETASDADAKRRDLEYIEEGMELAQIALRKIDDGNVICEMSTSILVVGDTMEELKEKRQEVISTLADIDIVATPNLSQDLTFINNFIKHAPFDSNYHHLCDLRYPISFQVDSSVQVGDSGGEYNSPSIGRSI